MGQANEETTHFISEKDQRRTKKIGDMVSYISQFTPWESKCFPQALTGLILLRFLHIPSTIYFGVCKQSGKIEAHAWLRSGHQVITGEQEVRSFTPVAKYATIIRKKELNEDEESVG